MGQAMACPISLSLTTVKGVKAMYQAHKEAKRVQFLSAFNVNSKGVLRQKLNQHAIRYIFPDGSVMLVKAGITECHPKREIGKHYIHHNVTNLVNSLGGWF